MQVETGDSRSGTTGARGRSRGVGWFVLVLGGILMLGAAFVLFIVQSGRTLDQAADMRAFQRLAIAGQGFAAWPEIARQISYRRIFGSGPGSDRLSQSIDHPQFGRIPLRFEKCSKPGVKKGSSGQSNEVDLKPAGLSISGPTITEDPVDGKRARNGQALFEDVNTAICFSLGPIRLKDALAVPEGFLAILIIDQSDAGAGDDEAGDGQSAIVRPGEVIAQVGPEPIPIRSLTELPDLDDALRRRTQAVLEVAAADASGSAATVAAARTLLTSSRTDTLAPLQTVIAGKAFRLYPYPIQLQVKEGETRRLLLVGAMPARSPILAELRGGRLLAFGLLLAALLSLTPFLRLAFLGPVDGLRPVELVTLALGLVLIGALATSLAWLGLESLDARARDDARLKTAATGLVDVLTKDIAGAAGGDAADQRGLLREAWRQPDAGEVLVASRVPEPGSALLPNPDTVIFATLEGRQAQGFPTFATAPPSQITALFNLADRAYFRRLVREDFAGNSQQQARALAANLGIGCLEPQGWTIDHVLSRGDGIAKLIIALPIPASLPANCTDEQARRLVDGKVRMVGMTLVMERLIAPSLPPGVGYAVVDLAEEGWPSLFHSDPQRAHAELFKLSLGDRDHADFLARSRDQPPPACGGGSRDGAPRPQLFTGQYVGEPHRMAVARVPCTTWAVVTFSSSRLREAQAARPVEIAILAWSALALVAGAILVVVVWFLGRSGRRALPALWPDPQRTSDYQLAFTVAFAAGVALFLLGWLVPRFMAWWLLAALAVAIALPAWIVGRTRLSPDHGDARRPLDLATEWRFGAWLAAFVFVASVVPVSLVALDARAYRDAQFSAAASRLDVAARAQEPRQVRRIQKAVMGWAEERSIEPVDPCRATAGPYTRALMRATEMAPDDEAATAGEACAAALAKAPLGLVRWVAATLVALAALSLPFAALFSLCRNLFGFGLPLEAVEYPRLREAAAGASPPYDEEQTPERAILVAASDPLRRDLYRYSSMQIDLFEAESRDFAQVLERIGKEAPDGKPRPLIIVHNLELLHRQTEPGERGTSPREEALNMLEKLVREQDLRARKASGEPRHFRLLIVADISPLDRFLQANEFRDELLDSGAPVLANPTEAIRWSRLLEDFTTYTGRARPRTSAKDKDELLKNRGSEKQRKALRHLLTELDHVPDRVVQALLPDPHDPLTADEILDWGAFLKDSRPRAISDFLASQLIEHWHYLWAISSRAEQILIHRFAMGELPNVRTAYALRSLVRRGIVVFDSSPRLMSRSFAQFVRHVERPELLSRWESEAPKGLWSRLHGNLTVVLPLLLLLGITIVLRGAIGFEAAIPLVLAAGPALLSAAFGLRRGG